MEKSKGKIIKNIWYPAINNRDLMAVVGTWEDFLGYIHKAEHQTLISVTCLEDLKRNEKNRWLFHSR